MRVIITGGTGFIGRNLAADLAGSGHEVVLLSRNPAKASGLPAGSYTVTQADVDNGSIVNSAVADGTDPTGTPVRSVVSELLSVREHLETVIVSTTEGLVELTEEGKIVFANRTAVSILGMPEVDLISTKWTDHFEEGERSSVTGLFSIKKQKQQNGNPPSFRLRNGREITIKVLPVEGKKNHIVSLEDVTERRRAERAFSKAYADLEDRIKKRNEELANANTTLKKELAERLRMEGMLQQSRNTLRSVFDSISDPLILVDSHLNILMANRSTLDHFNFADYFEVLGKPFLSLVEGCYDDNSLKSIRSAIVDFQKLSLESSSSRQPGSHKKTVIYPIQEDHRKLGSAIIRITDITKEKNLEKEILQREKLATLGIEVVQETADLEPMENATLESSNEETEAEAEAEVDLAVPEVVGIKDPVRMYLKEMGGVPLLTSRRKWTWPCAWRQMMRKRKESWLRLT